LRVLLATILTVLIEWTIRALNIVRRDRLEVTECDIG